MKLTAENVDSVLKDCLFREEEITDGQPPSDAVLVEGVVRGYGMHHDRLFQHIEDVGTMLASLPSEFNEGWSFLNLCMTKDGDLWGQHRDVEALCVLAIGLGLGEWQLPREMWPALPGGVPYFRVKGPAELVPA